MKQVFVDESKFFEYGEVKLEAKDFKTRQFAVRICVPCTVFQAVSPSLLGSGWVDELRVRDPVAVWIPTIGLDRFGSIVSHIEGVEQITRRMILERVTETVRAFHQVARVLQDPADAIPMLPLGTYVTFRYRCKLDETVRVLEGIQATPVAGVSEFQWALSEVFACVLDDLRQWEESRRRADGNLIPPELRALLGDDSK